MNKKPEPDIKYLVFDCESVADGHAIAATRYPGEGLTASEAIGRFRQELLIESGRDFIPYTFHIPVSVVVAKLKGDFSIAEIKALDEPHYRSATITKKFWEGWSYYKHPTLVSFNGRGFDIPLLELAAYRYGISLPDWFNMQSPAYQQFRNRYNVNSHLDLHELLTNFGSTWFRGGLNLAAHLIAKPGKIDVQGDMVQSLFSDGKLEEINQYCQCDVLDTYFVFLRSLTLMGRLNIEKEKLLVSKAKEYLEEHAESNAAFRLYLANWSDWIDPLQA